MKNKTFMLKDIFDIFKGKRLTKEDMSEGNVNYIGAISVNNGIREKIGQEPLFKPNCITINYNGSVGEAFYQIKPFWASDDVNVLYLKNKTLNENIAMYLITVIKANKYRFSYGRKWTLDKMKVAEISLPVDDSDEIDWEYMENFISLLHNKQISTNNKSENQKLNLERWQEFKVDDLFETSKIRGKISSLNELNAGDTEIVSTTEFNNGIIGKYEADRIFANSITVSFNGACGYFSYHQARFNATSDVGVLKEKFKLNKYIAMFLITILNQLAFKYKYGRKLNGERLKDEIILLPATDNEPDWQFMEDYIKSLPYADRI